MARVARADEPTYKGEERQQMHHGRINLRRTISQPSIAIARVFCLFDQTRDPSQRCLFAHRRAAQSKGRAYVDFARAHVTAGFCFHRMAFPGQKGTVGQCGGAEQYAIHRHACSGRHQNLISNAQLAERYGLGTAIHQFLSGMHLQRRQFLGRGPRGGAGAIIEEPTDQQEEGQRQSCVEIDMLPAIKRFVKRHAGGQDDGKRNGHIHVQPMHAQGTPGAAEKRLP